MIKEFKQYNNLLLCDIHASNMDIFHENCLKNDVNSLFFIKDKGNEKQIASHIRVYLPATAQNVLKMQEYGFFFADRTLKTNISLNKSNIDFNKIIRLTIIESEDYKEEILNIAIASFLTDRRFHFTPQCDFNIASLVLKEWVNDLSQVLICVYKDIIIGFLALKEINKHSICIHLAAVDEKYRMTGAAMSLYARACQLAKERGYKSIEGRISSTNTAVMNIYSFFAASYSEPIDIYLKKVNHDS